MKVLFPEIWARKFFTIILVFLHFNEGPIAWKVCEKVLTITSVIYRTIYRTKFNCHFLVHFAWVTLAVIQGRSTVIPSRCIFCLSVSGPYFVFFSTSISSRFPMTFGMANKWCVGQMTELRGINFQTFISHFCLLRLVQNTSHLRFPHRYGKTDVIKFCSTVEKMWRLNTHIWAMWSNVKAKRA